MDYKINVKEAPRMFTNPVMEFLSKATPVLIWAVYLPVVVFTLYAELAWYNRPLWPVLLLAPAGILLWTFTEYMLHRYLFHWVNDNPWVQKFHFLIHGVHHQYPNDFLRLVMPIVPSSILAVVFFGLFYLLFSPWHLPLFAGFVTGYIMYDTFHYCIHYVKHPPKFFRPLWQHHLVHHFKPGDHAYGVSNRFWDRIFGTMPKLSKGRKA